MSSHHVIGIMGPGDNASNSDKKIAFEIGKLISSMGYMLLTGGRNSGVMEAAMYGAKVNSGITIGILPGNTNENMSKYVDIPITTGLGNARNAINILSSKVVIVVGEGAGTISEVALALKSQKPLIWLNYSQEAYSLFRRFENTSLYFIDNINNNELEQLINKLISNV
jgi:uncharacterized protein (TIGR00725 family)